MTQLYHPWKYILQNFYSTGVTLTHSCSFLLCSQQPGNKIYFAVYEHKNEKEKCGTHNGKLINFKENEIMKFGGKFTKLENIIPNHILRSRKKLIPSFFLTQKQEFQTFVFFFFFIFNLEYNQKPEKKKKKNRKHIAGRHFHGGGKQTTG